MNPEAADTWTQIIGGKVPISRAQDVDEDGSTAPPSSSSATSWNVETPSISRGSIVHGPVDQLDVRQYMGWGSVPLNAQPSWASSDPSGPQMHSSNLGNERKDASGGSTPTNRSFPYPYPNLSLPIPTLVPDFRMSVTLQPRVSVGPTPFGHRNWISFTGGSWSGTWGAGIVMPGGQDSQIIIPDGSARLETNYLLQTHGAPPAYISVKTTGWRTGPPEILAKLADPKLADSVDPSLYKFRIFVEMETGDERYKDSVNCGMWIGSGMRRGLEVIYDAYRVA